MAAKGTKGEVKYDEAKRDEEIAGQVYNIGGKAYRRRKLTNAVQADAEELSIEINSNRLKLVAVGRDLDLAFANEEGKSEDLNEAIEKATDDQKRLRAEQRDLVYSQAACFLEDEEGAVIAVDVLRDHMDRDDVVQLLDDIGSTGDDGPDPTSPAE